jgi:hypothetical protein
MSVVEGGLIDLDKPTNGGLAADEDGFTFLELCRKYYRAVGLDARALDLLIRWLRHAVSSRRAAKR